MKPTSETELRPLEWRGDARTGALFLLDQRELPLHETWIACRTVAEVAQAIRDMAVRGAPAIGIAAAYGMVLGAREGHVDEARQTLAGTRPTAVNLFWALERSMEAGRRDPSPERLLARARELHEADVEGNRKLSALGAARIEAGMGILTHCNAGALATGGVGTALGVIGAAHAQGKKIHVYVDETRPRLQGARLTTWELVRLGVPFTLICDGAAAGLMARGRIQLCVTGADRIARNGDTANKIGTYSVAVNAAHHGIPFHIAAPASSFDLSLAEGSQIPIEERSALEVRRWGTEEVCPPRIAIHNPAFDVTPAKLIRSIFTERGEIAPVNSDNVGAILGKTSHD